MMGSLNAIDWSVEMIIDGHFLNYKKGKTMTFCYMPILKWKQGEQRALKEFPSDLKHCLLPIIELMKLKIPSGTTVLTAINNELPKIVKTMVAANFDEYSVGIDTSLMMPAHNDIRLTIYMANKLHKSGIKVVPVLHPSMLFHNITEITKLTDFPELILRVKPSTVLPEQIVFLLNEIKQNFLLEHRWHVVLDTHDVVSTQAASLTSQVGPFITKLQAIPYIETITFSGGSFPMSMQGISQGSNSIDRVEWIAYQQLKPTFPDLKFGDYSVTNPVLMEVEDPSKMNPSVQIRYTRNNDWLVFKAGGSKTSGMGQYNDLCRLLIMHGDYNQPPFSYGDKNYWHHAQPSSTSGNYMTWRRDATSHHIVYTTRQLKGQI